MPLKEEFYSEHGKLIKVLKYSAIRQMSGRVIPAVWEMVSLVKPGNSTVILLVDVAYNQPIDENIFSLSNLKARE